jgi:hypothetical protein
MIDMQRLYYEVSHEVQSRFGGPMTGEVQSIVDIVVRQIERQGVFNWPPNSHSAYMMAEPVIENKQVAKMSARLSEIEELFTKKGGLDSVISAMRNDRDSTIRVERDKIANEFRKAVTETRELISKDMATMIEQTKAEFMKELSKL